MAERTCLLKDNVCRLATRAAGRQRLLALVGALLLGGCSGAGYYLQAANGQMDLLARRQPIAELLASPGTDAALHERLRAVAELREFAVAELALPDNGSYRSFVALDRPYVVWNVFAAPELSLAAHEWCYPFLGCLAYRGYFQEVPARAEAQRLQAQGLDTWVAGVPAYSTLGWLDDPVLSTFVHWPLGRVAELIFHELAHQRLFVSGDSTFNESYATVVGRQGAERWLRQRGDSEALAVYLRDRQRRDRYLDLAMGARARLETVYAAPGSEDDKRAQKRALFGELGRQYGRWRQHWGSSPAHERMVGGGNAWLAAIGTYQQWLPAFTTMLEATGGDFATFHRAVEALAAQSPALRSASLEALQPRQVSLSR